MLFGPLKFEPVYHPKIWGGESWEISVHEQGPSIVAQPPSLAGLSLRELCQTYPQAILGTDDPTFPLLIKLIDARDRLSVQVHPDDEYARQFSSETGKTEMWYVLHAKPGAKIIYGLKPGTTKAVLAHAIVNNTITDYLNEVPVQAGDFFYIPPGAVHAIGAGIMLVEIQQSSNIVYRLYDWDRVDDHDQPRQLHVDHALAVIDYGFSGERFTLSDDTEQAILTQNSYFTVEKHQFDAYTVKTISTDHFHIITGLNGSLIVRNEHYGIDIQPGESCLVPACCHNYEIVTGASAAQLLLSCLTK